MNGEFMQLYNKLDKRFSVLEALFTEKWKEHDKRSDSSWNNIKKQLTKLDELPCSVNSQKIKGLGYQINWLWGLFVAVLLLGVSAIFVK